MRREKNDLAPSFSWKCFIILRRRRKESKLLEKRPHRETDKARKRQRFPKHLEKKRRESYKHSRRCRCLLTGSFSWFLVVVLEVNTSRTFNDNTSSTAARMPHRRFKAENKRASIYIQQRAVQVTIHGFVSIAKMLPGRGYYKRCILRPARAGPDRLYTQAQLRDRKRISKRVRKDIKIQLRRCLSADCKPARLFV